LLVAHADARVRYRHAHRVVVSRVGRHVDLDAAALGREFDRVAEVAAQHMLQLVVVGSHLADALVDADLQLELLRLSGGATALGGAAHQVRQVD